MSYLSFSKSLISAQGLAASISTLALMASAPLAFALDNDVDAYDGSVLAGCANATPLTAAQTDGRFRNIVAGRQQCIETNARDNVVSGGFHTIGERAERNTVRGQQNTIGSFSSGNFVDGFTNVITNGGGGSFVFGDGNNVDGSSNNALGDDNTFGAGTFHNTIVGEGNGVSGNQTVNNFIAGTNNTITASQVRNNFILGDRNTITGSLNIGTNNFLSGTNGSITGNYNFVGGGNGLAGPSVTGNNNIVIGAGASSVVDDGVAIGLNSAATLSIAAAQATWAGGLVGSATLTEGTDATGGEFNIGIVC